MKSLAELVQEYAQVQTQRKQLEAAADELRNGREAELKQIILAEMSAQGIKSANVEGYGRIVRKDTSQFQIQDIDTLCYRMLEGFVAAAQQGRPLSDALLLQRRVHEGNLENYIQAAGGEEDAIAPQLGVKIVQKSDLTFTKTSV